MLAFGIKRTKQNKTTKNSAALPFYWVRYPEVVWQVDPVMPNANLCLIVGFQRKKLKPLGQLKLPSICFCIYLCSFNLLKKWNNLFKITVGNFKNNQRNRLSEHRYFPPYWSSIRISHCPCRVWMWLADLYHLYHRSVSKCFNWGNTLSWLAPKNCKLKKEFGKHIPLSSGGTYTYRCSGKRNLARLSNSHR